MIHHSNSMKTDTLKDPRNPIQKFMEDDCPYPKARYCDTCQYHAADGGCNHPKNPLLPRKDSMKAGVR